MNEIKDIYGINYDKIKPMCNRNHEMERKRGKRFKAPEKGECRRCNDRTLYLHDYYYDCKECNY